MNISNKTPAVVMLPVSDIQKAVSSDPIFQSLLSNGYTVSASFIADDMGDQKLVLLMIPDQKNQAVQLSNSKVDNSIRFFSGVLITLAFFYFSNWSF